MIETIFGEHVRPAETIAPAEWIGATRRGEQGTVGALVPNVYESVMRVHAPAPSPEDWWSLYREVFAVVASIGERHTSSPDRAWIAIWEGHGFYRATTHIAHRGPLDDEARRELDEARRALRDEDRRRNAAIRAALAPLQRFDLPHRSYYLTEGPVSAVAHICYPGDDGWRNPDLFWPDDRRWFVATDVDLWSLYVGGDETFVSELARNARTVTERVALDQPLEIED